MILCHLQTSPKRQLAIAVAAAFVLSGCASLTPEPISPQEILSTSAAERAQIQKGIEPLQGPLSLEAAIARAIKYNLERRAKIMEEAVATGQLEVGNYDLLPKLVASAGYRERDKELISNSKDSVTGTPSLSHPFISSDKSATSTDLSFTWSLLDFGQSYYASKQNADRTLIAAERRRKALHLLIQDVRTAFWRTASAQKLKTDVSATIAAAEEALADSRQAENERLRNPLDALRYQRQLLENLRLLEAIEQELSTARIELATLANLPLTDNLTVTEPDSLPNDKWLHIPIEQMEEQAIGQNADLRESFYSARIASQETRRALLRVFPGLSFNYAVKNSNDSFLINQNWTESGLQLSLNLLGLLSAPAQLHLAEAGIAVADQRRMATQMAVLSQLHIARLQYGNAYRQYERADAIAKVDIGIAEHMAKREQAQTQTKLDRVANQTSSILSQLRRYQSLAQVHAAASKLQATLGLEPSNDSHQNLSLQQLSEVVAHALKVWDEGRMNEASKAPAAKEVSKETEARQPETNTPVAVSPAPLLTPLTAGVSTEIAIPTSDDKEQAVREALQAWRAAWASGNASTYLDAYAATFIPANESSHAAWVAKKTRHLARNLNARIDLDDINIDLTSPQQASVSFKQSYQSTGYSDSVRKTLTWQQIDGRWLITGESNKILVAQWAQ